MTAVTEVIPEGNSEGIFSKYFDSVANIEPIKFTGRVISVKGLLIESKGPQAVIGEICTIETKTGIIQCEVVGLNGTTVQLMAYTLLAGIELGAKVRASGSLLEISVSPALLGRVLNAFGKPLDDKGPITGGRRYSVMRAPPPALSRPRISKRIATGVRSVDGLLACGKGQRLGVFAGSGVGKSTFQGMIARNTNADVNVIALIGERSIELNDFIEKSLGADGLKRSVIVVSTGDEPALCRLRGAYTATAIAEYFRDLGSDVMLLFDSVTRVAQAQREIGLSTGEPPAQRGFPPSMFDIIPKLVERVGPSEKGTITAFYTVLVEGDDLDEPVADTLRGRTDGHIVLSRELAARGHHPAVDVLASISRWADSVTGAESQKAAGTIRRLMAAYAESADLIAVGAYKIGTNPETDAAIAKHGEIESFLIQDKYESCSIAETLGAMAQIAEHEIPDSEMVSG